MEREWGNGKRMRKWKEDEEMEREWGNGEKMRKLRGNGERMKKWREISSLSNNFLFLLCNYFTTTLKYVTFCRKNLCIRSTRYGYEPKRLTFLRCVPNPHFNGVGMIVLSQHRRHDKSCASSRRRTWLCWWRTMKRLQKKGSKLGFVDA